MDFLCDGAGLEHVRARAMKVVESGTETFDSAFQRIVSELMSDVRERITRRTVKELDARQKTLSHELRVKRQVLEQQEVIFKQEQECLHRVMGESLVQPDPAEAIDACHPPTPSHNTQSVESSSEEHFRRPSLAEAMEAYEADAAERELLQTPSDNPCEPEEQLGAGKESQLEPEDAPLELEDAPVRAADKLSDHEDAPHVPDHATDKLSDHEEKSDASGAEGAHPFTTALADGDFPLAKEQGKLLSSDASPDQIADGGTPSLDTLLGA